MCKITMSICIVLALCSIIWLYPSSVNVNTISNSVVMLTDEEGHGSGAIVSSNCVLTAKHVTVHMPLVVKTADGDTYNVIKVIEDPDSDFAIVYIDGIFDETPLKFDPTPLEVGDNIWVIGCPANIDLPACVLPGTVVRVNLDVPELDEKNVDVLDAHAAPGCSGGPVVDHKGHIRSVLVIGSISNCGAIPVGELNVE